MVARKSGGSDLTDEPRFIRISGGTQKRFQFFQTPFHIWTAVSNHGIVIPARIGVESNIQKAIQYYTQAAEDEENYQAQFCLGRCYFNGNGVEQNYNEAIKWFMKAASQGEPDSIFHLAICYGNGLGVEQDNEKSLHYLITAANLGWQPAIEILKENGIEPTNK